MPSKELTCHNVDYSNRQFQYEHSIHFCELISASSWMEHTEMHREQSVHEEIKREEGRIRSIHVQIFTYSTVCT